MKFPIRHENHSLEQKSQIFLFNMLPPEWMPNKPQYNYGVDFQIGIAEGRELKGLEFAIQLKASEKSSGNDDYEDMILSTATYYYLKNLLTVVMLIKYVEDSNEAYWIFLRDINRPRNESQKSFTIHIPKANKLSTIDWKSIESFVRQITLKKLDAIK